MRGIMQKLLGQLVEMGYYDYNNYRFRLFIYKAH